MMLVSVLAAVALTAGCAQPAPRPASSPAPTGPQVLRPNSQDRSLTPPSTPGRTVTGTFRPWTPGATAISYDTGVVPVGAVATVTITGGTSGFTVRLAVTGMVPRRSYGAHLHTSPCTATPGQAGPHFQHMPDPKAGPSHPSVDPSYANPRNEVWLDFTADVRGAAVVTRSERWTWGETPPKSLIVHSDVTRTAKGEAGMAGPRVACLTLAGQ
jgi:Cu-Zn family superoxide dismutase